MEQVCTSVNQMKKQLIKLPRTHKEILKKPSHENKQTKINKTNPTKQQQQKTSTKKTQHF